ncbi:hypothetical protein LQW54_003196 [Pestalotiopsis sp. IQ-011]
MTAAQTLEAMSWYIYQVPKWASVLDAAALARIGRTMKDDALPPIGSFTEKNERKLRKVNGMIGVVEGGENANHEREGDEESQIELANEPSDTTTLVITLAPGASGFITKRLLSKKKKKDGKGKKGSRG